MWWRGLSLGPLGNHCFLRSSVTSSTLCSAHIHLSHPHIDTINTVLTCWVVACFALRRNYNVHWTVTGWNSWSTSTLTASPSCQLCFTDNVYSISQTLSTVFHWSLCATLWTTIGWAPGSLELPLRAPICLSCPPNWQPGLPGLGFGFRWNFNRNIFFFHQSESESFCSFQSSSIAQQSG